MDLRPITPDESERLAAMLAAMPAYDRTFFKEPVDVDTARRWSVDGRPRWLLLRDDEAVAYLAVLPGVGLSSHVGELRMIVAPDHRRQGIGSKLARYALLHAIELGLEKLTVEVAAEKTGDIEMFVGIGFEAEALLKDHIRDRDGQLRDLMVLSHQLDDVERDLAVVGIDRAVGLGGS